MGKFTAQAEIAVILILLIVGGISVYYAFRNEIIPTNMFGTNEEQKSVMDSVANMIRDGAYSTLHKLNMYGGYLEPQGRTVLYAGKERNYWQDSERKIVYPDIQKNFVNGLLIYLNKNKGYLQDSLKGKGVIFGNVSVSANILDDKIMINVKMPTIVKNKTIESTYRVEMQSRIGEIFKISKKIISASMNSGQRPFEKATILNMFYEHSKSKSKLPFGPLNLFGPCPQIYSKSWNEIKPVVENIVEKTVASACVSGYCKKTEVAPPEVKLDKVYSGVDINFALPDDFELNGQTLKSNPNPIYLKGTPIEYGGRQYCLGAMKVTYDIRYPVVVIVTDSLTRDPFIFVMDIFVNANSPGDTPESNYNKENVLPSYICNNKECEINLKVLYKYSNDPVQNAKINFGTNCFLGFTDGNGVLKTKAPCGAGVVFVNNENTGQKITTSKEATASKTIEIRKTYNIPIYLHEAIVKKENDTYKIEKLYGVKKSDYTVEVLFVPIDNPTNTIPLLTSKPIDSVNLKEGFYTIMVSPRSKDAVTAMFSGGHAYAVSKETEKTGYHIIIPYYEGLKSLSESEIAVMAGQTLPNLLKKCGIDPISTKEQYLLTECDVNESEVTGGSQ